MNGQQSDKQISDMLQACCDTAGKRGVGFADVRALRTKGTSLVVQDRRAEKIFYNQSSGIAVRVLLDGAWGFACCDGFDKRQLMDCLDAAIALARASAGQVTDPAMVCQIQGLQDQACWPGKLDPQQVSLERKVQLSLELERAGLDAGEGKIVNSIVNYGDAVREQWVANTAGTMVYSAVSRCRAACVLTAVEGDIRQQNFQVRGHQGGPELLVDLQPEQLSVLAAKKVLAQLRAKKAPAGEFPVIFHPTISGLLAHEALGHNAEADHLWSGQSILQDKLGQQVASELVTIVDDGSLEGNYGSEPFDSEGLPTGKHVIIRNGVWQQMLHTMETAARFNAKPTGSGRAQDHTCMPLCRMSNTFFEPGSDKLEDMIKGIEKGIYLREGREGYVITERGQFLCHASEAQMIEHGKLGQLLRDVSVSGLVIETLKNIDMVGSDFQMIFPGTCGKAGQGVATDCGGPHLRVSKMVVGGVDAQ